MLAHSLQNLAGEHSHTLLKRVERHTCILDFVESCWPSLPYDELRDALKSTLCFDCVRSYVSLVRVLPIEHWQVTDRISCSDGRQNRTSCCRLRTTGQS